MFQEGEAFYQVGITSWSVLLIGRLLFEDREENAQCQLQQR
jgi:hypothetical protein